MSIDNNAFSTDSISGKPVKVSPDVNVETKGDDSAIGKKIKKIAESDISVADKGKKIFAILNRNGNVYEEIADVLREGLKATKPVVIGGNEIHYEKDSPTILKYAELLLEVLDELKPRDVGISIKFSVEEEDELRRLRAPIYGLGTTPNLGAAYGKG